MIMTRTLFVLFLAVFGNAAYTLADENPCDEVPECQCTPGISNGTSIQAPCVNGGAVLLNAGFINTGCCPNAENVDCPTSSCVRKDAKVSVTNGCTCNLILRSGGVGGSPQITLAPGAVGNWGGGTYTTPCGKTTPRFVYAYCAGPPSPQPLLSGSTGDCTCVPGIPCLPVGVGDDV
jgi:hypothetical protein